MSSTHPAPDHFPRRHRGRFDKMVAGILFLACLALYHVNGDIVFSNDVTANVHLPMRILQHGTFSFHPRDLPFMFVWNLKTDKGQFQVVIPSWERQGLDGMTWRQLHDAGRLHLQKPMYYLVPSVDREDRGYISIYGPGVALVALPFFAMLSLLIPHLADHPAALWYGGKFVAAVCVAVSVVVIYLAARRFTRRRESLFIALAYSMGTNVWCMASQSLWQTGPSIMFVSLALYCFLRMDEHDLWALSCGATTACGVFCRETTAVFAIAIGAFLMARVLYRQKAPDGSLSGRNTWRPLLYYALAGLPFAIAMGAYNWYYQGSLWNTAKAEAARSFATEKLGSPDLWQTPFFTGFYGLLISPSRGVLIYSPVILFAIWGMVRVWRRRRFRVLSPLTVVILLYLVMYAKYFDWHSGWSFGSRYMTDVFPMLALCGTAVAGRVRRRWAWALTFLLALGWSVAVQVIGSFAYDVDGWNNRQGYCVAVPTQVQLPTSSTVYSVTSVQGDERRVYCFFVDRMDAEQFAQSHSAPLRPVPLDVDKAVHRRRLWSVRDNQLLYYVTNFRQSRLRKEDTIRMWLRPLRREAADKPLSNPHDASAR